MHYTQLKTVIKATITKICVRQDTCVCACVTCVRHQYWWLCVRVRVWIDNKANNILWNKMLITILETRKLIWNIKLTDKLLVSMYSKEIVNIWTGYIWLFACHFMLSQTMNVMSLSRTWRWILREKYRGCILC